MSQNVIIRGRDNPVVISFSFNEGDFTDQGLNTFSEITVTLRDTTYSTLNDPDKVIIENNTDLKLILGTDSSLEKGSYLPIILGYSNVYTQGYELTGKNKPILEYLSVV